MNRRLFLVLISVVVLAPVFGMEDFSAFHKSNFSRTLSSVVSKLPFFSLEKTKELPSIGQVIQIFGVARNDIMCGLALLPQELRFDIVNKLLNDEQSVNDFLKMPFLSAITRFHELNKKQEEGNLFLKTINPGKLFRLPLGRQNFVIKKDENAHILEQHIGTIIMTPKEFTSVLIEQDELGESFLPENTSILIVNPLTCHKKYKFLKPLIVSTGGVLVTETVLLVACASSECSAAAVSSVGIGIPFGLLLLGGIWSFSRYIDVVRKNSYSITT